MKNLKRIEPGERIRAEHFNQIIDALNESRLIDVGPGLSMHPVPGGTVLGLAVPLGAMGRAAKTQQFYAKITASQADGTNRWGYSWQEVVKTVAGYGANAWTQPSGGRVGDKANAGTAGRNTIEYMNSAVGTQGNGVNVANLTGTFALKAAPAGAIVLMNVVPVAGGAHEYWFSYENGVDGACP